MTTYFTSDLHLGHQKIITMSNRPFADVAAMNNAIIERWNAVVQKSDTVYFLGDFCWSGYEHMFHQLRGSKHLIIGNHDTHAVLTLPWASQPQWYVELNGEFRPNKLGKRPKIVLSHYGMRSWSGMYKDAIMLYGHSHNKLPGFRVKPDEDRVVAGATLDVGVDAWDFRPVTLEQIKARIATLPEYSTEMPDQRNE